MRRRALESAMRAHHVQKILPNGRSAAMFCRRLASISTSVSRPTNSI